MRIQRVTGVVLAGLLLAQAGCGGGEDVTAASIQTARQRWRKAGLHDYDLEWTSFGLRQSHYVVAVRDDKVRTVAMVQPNGGRTIVRPPEPRFYGVDGLFLVIADELAQLATDRPFGQPKGTKAVLRFTPDPKLGYPQRYRRDVLGSRASLGIDVVRLTPNSNPAPAPAP